MFSCEIYDLSLIVLHIYEASLTTMSHGRKHNA